MRLSAKPLSHLGTVVLLGLILVELTFRLSSFPGLHGDEAWFGLDALEMVRHGSATLNGMNSYTGALFPQIVTTQFWLLGASVFSLRLPGALCNWLAVVIVAATFWKRGHSAFFATLLFASSLLFLFYSRVAWEVTALQNLLLAIILAALYRLLRPGPAAPGWAFLFFLAFWLGVWNHFIFLTAAVSLALASAFLALRRPGRDSVRAFLLNLFNLPLQAILVVGKLLTPAGGFATHDLPTMLVALALVGTTSIAFTKLEPLLSPWFTQFPERNKTLARRITYALAAVAGAALLLAIPLDGVSFFGTLSGYIMEERVVSHVPSPLETVALHAVMAVLVAAYCMLAYRTLRPAGENQEQVFKPLLLLWTVLFFPILRPVTAHGPDRYFIIAQFLFFCSLALTMAELPLLWRRGLQGVMALFFLYGQLFFWHEVVRPAERPPLDFRYGFYEDTSWHFLKMDRLQAYLDGRGLCAFRSSSYFIEKPLRFLLATGPACRGAGTVRIEYCHTCRQPIPWFAVTPDPPQPDKASSN